MLQPAVAVVHGIQHEQVVLEWNRRWPRLLRGALFFIVLPCQKRISASQMAWVSAEQACAVKARRCARHDEAVRDAAGVKVAAPEVAQLHRAVHQLS